MQRTIGRRARARGLELSVGRQKQGAVLAVRDRREGGRMRIGDGGANIFRSHCNVQGATDIGFDIVTLRSITAWSKAPSATNRGFAPWFSHR